MAQKYYPGDSVRSSGWINDSYWESVIQATLGDKYKVKITAVNINTPARDCLKGICTGNVAITPESVGRYIWVNKWCFD